MLETGPLSTSKCIQQQSSLSAGHTLATLTAVCWLLSWSLWPIKSPNGWIAWRPQPWVFHLDSSGHQRFSRILIFYPKYLNIFMKTCSSPAWQNQLFESHSIANITFCLVCRMKFPGYHFISTDSAKCSNLGFIYFIRHVI